jgi:hypothetical protein
MLEVLEVLEVVVGLESPPVAPPAVEGDNTDVDEDMDTELDEMPETEDADMDEKVLGMDADEMLETDDTDADVEKPGIGNADPDDDEIVGGEVDVLLPTFDDDEEGFSVPEVTGGAEKDG